jgi:hypothetical protein
VAWYMGARDAKWLDGTEPEKTRLKVGQKLAIAKGLIEVQYVTGAVVVIEGPAEFTVGTKAQREEETARGSASSPQPLDPKSLANSGFLKLGKLVARVEGKKADDFTIDTPSGRVEDQGTEFGVEAHSDGRTKVQVFAGKVTVASMSPTGELLPAVGLSKNQSLVVQRGVRHSVVRSVVKRDEFMRPLPDHSAALEAGLVAHWKLDDRADSRLVQAEVGSDGTFSQNTQDASVEGRVGSALNFGKQHSVRINSPNALLMLSEFTVAAWVRNYDGGQSNMMLAWSDGTLNNRLHWELHDGCLTSFFAGEGAGPRADQGDKLTWKSGIWYHVAWSQSSSGSSSGEMRMYRDGRLVGGPFVDRPAPRSLQLNRADIGSLNGKRDYTFSGEIDDVQVYRRALAPAEIMSLYDRPGTTLSGSNNPKEVAGDVPSNGES